MSGNGFAGLDPCVHCGFCLQSCPTFLVTGDEADSPRGRIVLMQQLAAEQLDARDQTLIAHLDRCLGCRGCEPVCPSGVSYGSALETARYLLSATRPVPFEARVVHKVMADETLRRPALALARLLRPLAMAFAGESPFRFALGMLAATSPLRRNSVPRRRRAPVPFSSPAPDGAGSAIVFRGCIMEGLFDHVHAATERVLRANGYQILEAPGQGCCGALHAHAGQHETAIALARNNLEAFADSPNASIAINSAGCGAMLKEYGRLLGDDSAAKALADRVRDVSELLSARGPVEGGLLDIRVAYDPPCHLLHAQRIADPPRVVLDAIPGLEHVPHAEAELCCGSAGSYSLTQRRLSRAILRRKTGAIIDARPDVVATGNPGCAMQIGAGLLAAGAYIPIMHPVELLDLSYDRIGHYGR